MAEEPAQDCVSLKLLLVSFSKMIWSNYCNCLQFLEEEQPFFFLLSIKRRENGFESDVKLSLEAALCFLATAEKLLGSANCNGCLMHRYF